MTRPIGPRVPVSGPSASPAWAIVALCALPAAGFGIIWAGASLASLIAGGRVVPYGWGLVFDLAGGHPDRAWPGVPPALAWTCSGVLAALVIAAAAAAWLRALPRMMRDPGDPAVALSGAHDALGPLTLPAVAEKALKLRPSLAGTPVRKVAPADAGMVLGDLLLPGGRTGQTLYASWEETELDLMGPRAGKTTSRAVPLTLAAPGPALATSNKQDLWQATHELRGRLGPVHLFDPCGVAYQDQQVWIDLLAPVTNVETANRLAGHFVTTVADDKQRDLWGPAAQSLLTALFLAASTSGRTLRDVAVWLDQPSGPLPAVLLEDGGFPSLASSLTGTQNGAPETRDGIYETARTAAKALRDDDIVRWVTPQDLPRFDPDEFTGRTGTLYALSESQSYAAPLVAAVTDLVIRAGIRRAQRNGGRLDPPALLMLDECANICKISDLPGLYSYLGSHGVNPVCILQSYEQGEATWGAPGMAALWGAATVKIIGAGVDSARLTREISDLIGQHDVPVRSLGLGGGNGISENLSTRQQAAMQAADVRALPRGQALLLTSGNRAALLKLRNWFTGPDEPAISAAIERAGKLVQEGALRHGTQHEEDSHDGTGTPSA